MRFQSVRAAHIGCALLMSIVAGCSNSTAQWAEQARDANPAKRLEAVHVLGERANESASVVPVLIDALQDKNTFVRRDAARALGTFGADARDAVEPLILRLRDEEPSVRRAAGQSLKQIDPEAATKAGVR